jgi:hypothetical protein
VYFVGNAPIADVVFCGYGLQPFSNWTILIIINIGLNRRVYFLLKMK